MAHYNTGDTSNAICEDCKTLVETTFVVRDVPFSNGIGIVTDILFAVCNNCDTVVAIPAQSTAAINAAMNKLSLELK